MSFKKKISLYMAIIMLFNLIVPFASPAIATLQAAGPNLTVDLTQGIETGVVNWVPVVGGQNSNQIFAQFPVPIGGVYEMRVRTHEGWDLIVFVQRGFDTINVTHDIDFRQGQGGSPMPSDGNYEVFHAPSEGDWFPIDQYLDPSFIRPMQTTGPALTGIVWGEPGNNEPPSFLIPTNGGFSIRYFFRELHFFFDGENFNFASSGFEPGYVYTMTLRGLLPNPGYDPDDPNNTEPPWIPDEDNSTDSTFNLGFSPITVQPFANAGDQVGPYLGDRFAGDPDSPTHFNARATQNIIHHSRFPYAMAQPPEVDDFVLPGGIIPNEFPRWPANPEEPLGFIMEFGVPTIAGEGVEVPDYAEVLSNASLILSGNRHSFTLRLDDVFDPNFNENNVYPMSGSGFSVRNAEVFYDAANAPFIRLELEIGDGDPWLPSLFYNGTSTLTLLPVASPDRDTVGSMANPNRGSILPPTYTLLHYGISIIDGQYFVDIKTNYQHTGVYIVIEGADPTFLMGDPLQLPFVSVSPVVNAGQAPSPVPVRGNVLAATGRYFQVFFLPLEQQLTEFERNEILAGRIPDNALRSQVLWFRGSENDLTLRTPQLFTVNLEDHTPNQGNVLREEGVAELRTTWDIGTYDLIHNLHERLGDADGNLVIYYDLSWTLTPVENDELPPTTELFARVQVTFTTEAGVASVSYVLMDNNNNPITPDANGVSTLDGLQMLTTGQSPPIVNPVLSSYMADVFFRINTYHQLHSGAPAPTVSIVPPRGIRFPAVYFMNVQAMIVAGNDDIQVAASEFDSFSISDFDTPRVPPPQNLVISNPVVTTAALGDEEDRVSFDLTWEIPGSQLRTYLSQSFGLLPYEGENPFDFEMTIYISQDEDFMRDDFSNIRATQGEGHHIPRRAASVVADASNATPPIIGESIDTPGANNRILVSNINNDNFNLSIEARNALRNGNVVAITGLRLNTAQWDAVTTGGALYTVSYTIDGLDKNQSYFVYVDFVATQNLEDNEDFPIEEASFLSNLGGILMPDDPEVPDGVDREPPSVDLNVEEGSITRNSVILYWNRIQPMLLPETYTETLEYEIIRTRDNQMSEEHLNNRVPFAQLWNSVSGAHTEIIGARTSGSALQSWAGSEWGGEPNLMEILSAANATPIRLWDGSLSANTLYFYYVRVVRTVVGPSGTFQTYSVWANVTVTTTIASSPRNLRIESGREDFDRQTEIMISFEAPLEFATLSEILGNTASGVRLQYQLRPDDGDWLDPVFMRDSF
ncbi:MAG: hypothetical protein FWG64_01555, partial [Firmicutes bacterium]|nr:hypothetical protein [Bacillota bacterium]